MADFDPLIVEEVLGAYYLFKAVEQVDKAEYVMDSISEELLKARSRLLSEGVERLGELAHHVEDVIKSEEIPK
ncbi:hypothetical protein AP064_05160 [Candidatus Liberibacter solanacearum]|uniref:Uncharacterized protein n=3 Tax=Candidatus Liberibacter solanacearum TaxID=556287 RepID=E4UC71_LIBSC|nr:hypothetical protein CKC_01050 [Candidatus Liberibacter solanacearum CLso-ZC1]ADR52929.1 hypothetical protein CKC_05920 [Candidatus Liberibacter solanacearum CLso-ZC1]KJZ82506.1 hypothetical protein DJ66_0113 [Candidatus Liberibacter solanacearum]KQC48749.1 hypothetical protein AP064_05160 [Candidatus Liberibacter solanacearum]